MSQEIAFDEEYFNSSENGYSKGYIRFDHYAKRAQWIKDNLSGTILEIGCAYGYLIEELAKLGISIQGIDKSGYAVSQKQLPSSIIQADVADHDWKDAHFNWVVSWNVLDCLDDDAHASQIATVLNSLADNQLHVICMSGQDYTKQGYFVREYNYWRDLLPDAYLVDHETKTMYVPDGKNPLSGVPLCWELVSD